MKIFKLIMFLAVSVAFFLGGVSGCTTMHLSTIDSSSFISLPRKIYVDPALEDSDKEKLFTVIESAEKRIEELVGEYSATPVIIVVVTKENKERYGLGPFPGKAYISPWETYIVISNKIETDDLLAHEMMHAHISSTVGYWAYMTKLPAWFDEGLAMQLDNRENYVIDGVEFSPEEIQRIKTIESPSDFRTTSKEQDIMNYRASKVAVRQILNKIDGKEINRRMKEMKDGKRFSYVLEGS